MVLACHESCQSCSSNSSSSCLSCKAGFFLYENSCVSTCPSSFYPNSTDNTCYPQPLFAISGNFRANFLCLIHFSAFLCISLPEFHGAIDSTKRPRIFFVFGFLELDHYPYQCYRRAKTIPIHVECKYLTDDTTREFHRER